MKSRVLAVALVLFAVGRLTSAGASQAEGLVGGLEEGLSGIERHFESVGLEPLPGQTNLLVEGGVAGFFRGSSGGEEEKPYVLVMDAAGGGGAVAFLTVIGKHGLTLVDEGREIAPTLVGLGRHVIVAYWEDPVTTGEGIIPLEQVAAHLDLSGIARGAYQRLLVRATGSSPIWPRLIEQTNIPIGLNLDFETAPDLGSPRAAALFGGGIPGLQFVTETSESLAVETGRASASVTAFVGLLAAKVSRLDEPPSYQRVEEDTGKSQPTSARPYTGTIPDYTADVEGLRLDGVLEGGPAEAAGLREGDIIVELAGSSIKDVYDYAKVLDTLEIDQAISVVFLRDGERLETELTPRGRE